MTTYYISHFTYFEFVLYYSEIFNICRKKGGLKKSAFKSSQRMIRLRLENQSKLNATGTRRAFALRSCIIEKGVEHITAIKT